MRREVVEIVFKKDGTVETHIQGIKGGGCSSLAKDIEGVLGSGTDTRYTDEYYQQELEQEQERRR